MLLGIGAIVVWLTTELALKPLGRHCDELTEQVQTLSVRVAEEAYRLREAELKLRNMNLARAAVGDPPHTVVSYIQTLPATARKKLERGKGLDDPVLELLQKKGGPKK
jgi:hypothetical protein